jgi:hypothetical protein
LISCHGSDWSVRERVLDRLALVALAAGASFHLANSRLREMPESRFLARYPPSAI